MSFSRAFSEPLRSGVIGRMIPAVGNWQLIQLLARGRWTDLYRARPRALGPQSPSDYVVKLARPGSSDEVLAAQLLQREALIGTAVSHPHLCCVLSSHVHRTPYYVVMPYLDGMTVEDQLARSGPMSASRALWIVRQAAAAMTALHESGWIHSDIKPSNIFLASDNHVTLLDLGLVL